MYSLCCLAVLLPSSIALRTCPIRNNTMPWTKTTREETAKLDLLREIIIWYTILISDFGARAPMRILMRIWFASTSHRNSHRTHISRSTGSISMYDSVSGPSWPRGGHEVVFVQIQVLKVSYLGRKGSRQGTYPWVDRARGRHGSRSLDLTGRFRCMVVFLDRLDHAEAMR